ncbi:putative OmpA/MotB domain-containing protein [Magnetofaba australis IT-1]|uniref:Putative OmpA/MotB domain-containing protein n=2 Tax=Magnetofaba TaxID=1472292 RepID=A0A1Y2K356_9PROT|nr:putative OmpA/MotB domain-containing protein [Magnetofaba australis IT-1]
MVTFGDLMSLLLTFFVLLLSFAQMEIVKFEKVAGAIQNAFGVQQTTVVNSNPTSQTFIAPNFHNEIVLVKLVERLDRLLEGMIQDGNAGIGKTDEGVLVRLSADALFHRGSAQLLPAADAVLFQLGETLNDDEDTKRNKIYITGHTDDSRPAGGAYVDNWALSGAQAASVAAYLTLQAQMDPLRFETRAMGQEKPIDDNATAVGRLANRRLDILISKEPMPTRMNDNLEPLVEQPRDAYNPNTPG